MSLNFISPYTMMESTIYVAFIDSLVKAMLKHVSKNFGSYKKNTRCIVTVKALWTCARTRCTIPEQSKLIFAIIRLTTIETNEDLYEQESSKHVNKGGYSKETRAMQRHSQNKLQMIIEVNVVGKEELISLVALFDNCHHPSLSKIVTSTLLCQKWRHWQQKV